MQISLNNYDGLFVVVKFLFKKKNHMRAYVVQSPNTRWCFAPVRASPLESLLCGSNISSQRDGSILRDEAVCWPPEIMQARAFLSLKLNAAYPVLLIQEKIV